MLIMIRLMYFYCLALFVHIWLHDGIVQGQVNDTNLTYSKFGNTLKGIQQPNNPFYPEDYEFICVYQDPNPYCWHEYWNDRFGEVITMSSDGLTLAVASPSYGNVSAETGRVQVFQYNTSLSVWGQLGAPLVGQKHLEGFGYSIAISGDGRTIVVGSFEYFEPETNRRVSVYRYKESINTWQRLGTDIRINEPNLVFGGEVDISSDGFTIGLYLLYEGWSDQFIRVLKYAKAQNTWQQMGGDISSSVTIPAPWPIRESSYIPSKFVISGDGETIAVGVQKSVQYDDTPFEDKPYVYRTEVYSVVRVSTLNPLTNQWEQLGSELDGIANTEFLEVGKSIAISSNGMIVAVATPSYATYDGEIFKGEVFKGTVSVYEYNSLTLQWQQLGRNLDDVRVRSSIAMSADGKTVAIGTWDSDVKVFRFDEFASQWQRVDSIELTEGIQNYQVGASMDISADGTIIAIGDPEKFRDESTFVEVFKFGRPIPPTRSPTKSPTIAPVRIPTSLPPVTVGSWDQIGDTLIGRVISYPVDDDSYDDESCECRADGFGSSVSLSSDGLTLVVGAPYYGIYEYPRNIGRVHVFRYNKTSAEWEQWGNVLETRRPYEYFGTSVVISSDGTTLFAAGVTRARAFKYDISSSKWEQIGSDLEYMGEFGYSIGRGTSLSISSNGLVMAFYQVIGSKGVLVRVFRYLPTTNEWDQIGSDINDEFIIQDDLPTYAQVNNDPAHLEMSDDGTTLAFGVKNKVFYGLNGPRYQNSTVLVYHFNSTTGQWENVECIIDGYSGTVADGKSIAMSADGRIIAVTNSVTVQLDSRFSEVEKGRGQVYKLNPISLRWEQLGADLEGVNGALAMSSDGSTVALSTNCTEADGFSVYFCVSVHKFDSSLMQWRQVNSIRSNRQSVVDDEYGFAIHLSADGTIVAVGAPEQNYKTNFVEVYSIKNEAYAPVAAPFSIKPPVVAPIRTPVLPIVAPMNAPSNIPECVVGNNIATYQLYDSGSDTIISALTNGTVVINPPPIDRTNIEAVIACNEFGAMKNRTRVEILLFNATTKQMIHSRVENYVPYLLFGNNPRNIYSGRVEPGTYQIRVVVNQTIVSPLTTFTLLGISSDTPVRSPLVSPVMVSSPIPVPDKVPVKLPVQSPSFVLAPTTPPRTAPMNAPSNIPECVVGNNIAAYQLYDSGSDTIISALTNGTVVKNPPPINRTNIEAVIACNEFGAMKNRTRVEIQLFNAATKQIIHSRVENYVPYFLFGNNPRNIYSGRMEPGTYQIRVVVNQTIVSPLTTFTLL